MSNDMKSAQRIITAAEEATILKLIADQTRALNEGKSELTATITCQMMEDFGDVLCLACGHQAYLHGPAICAGGKGEHVCICPGIRLRQ